MLKRIGLKRLLILVALFSLLFAALTGVMAQEGGEGETGQTEEHAEEPAEAGGGPLDALGINLGFLLARGVFHKSWTSILVALAILFGYGGLLWGVLPGQDGVSWQSHLFGFLAGVAVARLMARTI